MSPRGTHGVPRRTKSTGVQQPTGRTKQQPAAATQPDTPVGETVLNFNLRDPGAIDDYLGLHQTAKAASEQAAQKAQQARAEEAQHNAELAKLRDEAAKLAAEIGRTELAAQDAGSRASDHEADAGQLYRRSQDHAETYERLRVHNNLPHTGSAAGEDVEQAGAHPRPPEFLDQTEYSHVVPSRAS